jgi:hypothetical protein
VLKEPGGQIVEMGKSRSSAESGFRVARIGKLQYDW